MNKETKKKINRTKKVIIWSAKNFIFEIKELFSWIVFRAKKIKKRFLAEFYPSETTESEKNISSNSEFRHEEILNEFKNWLEEFSDSELETLKEEIKFETDLPSFLDIYSNLTALKENYQRQAKSGANLTKTFQEELKKLHEELERQNIALQNSTNNFNVKIVEARKLAKKESLIELIYIHEGLERCVIATEKEKISKSFWNRKARATANRLKENQKVILEKSDDALRRLNVIKTAKKGQVFNPKIMKAVAINKNPEVADSTITKVLRQGYAVDNQIIQTAEVEVAKYE